VETLGTRFKRERERQGMTLDEVALATKIGVRMLQAIEEDHFDRLPGGIFNKGFVRAYARHLGLDESQALADYTTATGVVVPAKEPEVVLAALATHAERVRRTERAGRGEGLPWVRLAILLLLIALGFALWNAHSRKSQPRTREGRAQAASQPATPSAASVGRSPREAGAQASTALPPAFRNDKPAASANPPSPSPAPGAISQPGTFSVRILAREDSWVLITADGKQVRHQLLVAQSENTIEAQQEIVVKAGNAKGLDFWFNGKKLAAQGGPNKVKTLAFAATGLQKLAAKAQLPAEQAPSQP